MSNARKDEVPGATPLRDTPLEPAGRQPESARPPVPARTGAAGTPGGGRAGDEKGEVDQGACQGFDRQRLEPQDTPPAEVRDDENLAGEKDFELQPPPGPRASG